MPTGCKENLPHDANRLQREFATRCQLQLQRDLLSGCQPQPIKSETPPQNQIPHAS